MEIFNKILTVDPGIHTGIALWNGNIYPDIFEINCPQNIINFGHFEYRNYLCDSFKNILSINKNKINKVYLEGTQNYNSLISSTSIRKGTLFELSYLIGRYEQICYKMNFDCKIINAPKWKGQMTKETTASRIKMINGIEYKNDHITDAVGIGFGLMNMFQWRKEK
jgi:hypothetical protein